MTRDELRRRGDELLARIAGPGASFRSGQWEAIESLVVDRHKVLVVQRTGWGKSAVYVIATRLLRDEGAGATIIVSPLLSLMRNQIEAAERAGIVAETVNSTNREDWDAVFSRIERNQVDLLLISPERLNNDQFRRDVLPGLIARIGLLVVDEVHCISDWGHDFRPDYRRLGKLVASMPPGVPVLGTTATANDRVVDDVAAQLGAEMNVHRGRLERESLALQVIDAPDRSVRLAWLAERIPQLPGSGIVYCLTIRDALRVGEWLRDEGIEAATYTGQTDADDRLEIEDRLSTGALKVVVATSALGMGYDNPHIEFVIHYQGPGSPVAYYQQVGRAGRAVDHSYGVLLVGEEDRRIQDHFIETAFPEQELAALVLSELADGGRKESELLNVVNIRMTRLRAMLKVLEVEGAVTRDRGVWEIGDPGWMFPAETVEAVTAHRRAEQQAMVDYTRTGECLMAFLRRCLDDPDPEPCGRCANCRGGLLPVEVSDQTQARALAFLNRGWIEIPPRKRWPAGISGPPLKGTTVGRALTTWGDPGLAALVAAGLESGFDDRLVSESARMVRAWDPQPAPTWVTAVPSLRRPGIVEDLARRLAAELGLEFVEAITQTRPRPPQKQMENPHTQARNTLGMFQVEGIRSGPVLLVDDTVDSRWTTATLGAILVSQGCQTVHPLVLSDTSRS